MVKKRKLIWNIFPSFLVIVFLSLSAVAFCSTNYFKEFFLKNSEKELTIRANLLQNKFADILEAGEGHVRSIDKLCKDIGEKTGMRVTVILPSGVVAGDSLGDVASLDPGIRRPEVEAALRNEKGVSIRYSQPLEDKMMHVAVPLILDSEVRAVVRTSISVSAIEHQIQSVQSQIFLALLLTIIVAAFVSLYVTSRITHPIEKMKRGASEFARGNLESRLEVPGTEELSELAVTMNRMAENLDEKIKLFENRTKELEAIHTSMQEGVIAIDKDEKIITINNAAVKILDFPSSGLKARYILEVARNVAFYNFVERALATHEPVEDDIVIKRDEPVILNIHSTVLYDNANNRMGTLIIFHDISRIRRLERMQKEFASNVSHELKTPLTSIKGFIETLQQTLKNGDKDASLKFIQIIEKNVTRMTDLINDLLALGRLERLRGTGIEFENQGVAALIRGAVKTCKSTIETKGITVNIQCPKDLKAMVDPVLMEQAIFNLVDNAVKYSHEKSTLNIVATKEVGYTDIVVTDDGPGMDKEHLSKIFNRFYRVDKARSRNEGGTGLGLAIVKHIVQYHNGRIDVKSERGKGSAFKISIPA